MSDQESSHSRFGLFGDLPTRLLNWAVRTWPGIPHPVEEAVISLSSLVIYLAAQPQRKAIQRNFGHIWPDSSWPERFVAGLQVFRNFAWTSVDSARMRLNQTPIVWSIEGREVFEQLKEDPDGCLLFTTHTGNYDLAGALFSEKFGRLIHTVRVPERSEELQTLRKAELDRDQQSHPNFRVHYNKSEELLGIELARLLSDGEIVAIQCDRVFGAVSALEIPYGDGSTRIRLPKGPMVLAAISRRPCIPLYVTRSGYRTYTITFQPPLQVSPPPGKRKPGPEDYAQSWEQRLRIFLEPHATQWFVFEDAFTSK